MNTASVEFKSSLVSRQCFCPVTGLPIHSRPDWQEQKLGPDYHADLCLIGHSIIHNTPTGTVGKEEMLAGLDVTRRVIDHVRNPSGGHVIIVDVGMINHVTTQAHKAYMAFCNQNHQLQMLIYCNASPLMKVGIKLGQRFNRRGFAIHIAENYPQAIKMATDFCAQNSLPNGPLLFKPIPALRSDEISLSPVEISSSDAWCFEHENFWNRSVLIDRTIMFSQPKGVLAPAAVDTIQRLRMDVRSASAQGSQLDYIIMDARQFEGGNWLTRKKYVHNLKEWSSVYPLKMFIIVGANTFMRTAMQLAKPFLPFDLATANDVDGAFALVKNKDAKQGLQHGHKRYLPYSEEASPQDIEKILAYIGGIDWEEKGIDLDLPFGTKHQFHPIARAIRLIKGELDDLFQELNTALKALQLTEQKYRELFEKGSDWIGLHDLEGNLLETNLDFKTELDRRAWKSMNPTLRELIPERFHPQLKEYLERIRRKGRDKGLLNVTAKDGQEIVLEYKSVLISDDRGDLKWVKSWARDITTELKAAEESERLQKKLLQSQKMESIGTLAGGIAHDFNNILASVIGFTELAIEDAGENRRLKDNLQNVLDAGQRASDLVRQILTFARQSDVKRSPIQVSLIAKELLKLLRSTLPATIEIQQRIESDAMILGNPSQVHQILMNLCTNAAHAMEEKGGFLQVRLEDVAIDPRADDRLRDLSAGVYLKLSVADTGPGIAPEIIDSIFEPYFTTKEPDQGTGMGLAIVHGIVKGYGGEVYVESRPGSGAVFTVLIPVARKSKAEHHGPPGDHPTGCERILLVDDELPILRMGYHILVSLGYSVTTRVSSSEALALFEAQPQRFDLVITDMTMPEMTGDQLAERMVAIRPDLPVIMCTGFSKKMSQRRAAEIGIRALIHKPIVKTRLAKIIREVLDSPGQPRPN